jgi:uncharacterized protein (TIGR00369 family)
MTDRSYLGEMMDHPDRTLLAGIVQGITTDTMVRSNPVFEDLACQVLSATPGRVTLLFTPHERSQHSAGIVHGGVVSTMLDGAMAFAVLSHLTEGESTATISLTVNFLGATRMGECEAEAHVERLGKRVAFAHARLTSGGRLTATATASFAMLRPEPR